MIQGYERRKKNQDIDIWRNWWCTCIGC